MGQLTAVEDQVIGILQHNGACDLEEAAHQCTNLTWNQVCLAIDHLSRCGEIRLVLRGRGMYTMYTLTIPHRQGGRPAQRSLPS